jgi:hypothetical protein
MKHRSPKRTVRGPAPMPLASHFRRDGTAKMAYRTKQEAASAAQLAWTLDQVDLDSYRCDHCHQWHIGRRFRED